MAKILHLHNIQLKSATAQHEDLPPNMQLSAQLIADGKIFLQTIPVESRGSQNSWELRFDCKIPEFGPIFKVAILRHSETRGTRLLGSVKIGRTEALASVEQKNDFHLLLKKVNLDGPSIRLSADFGVSWSSTTETFGWDSIDVAQFQIDKLDNQIIMDRLEGIHAATDMSSPIDSQELWVIHESILLLSNANKTRAQFLNMLGDVCFLSYQRTGTIVNLNQAICAYGDAVRDDPTEAKYHGDLGVPFRHRFERLGQFHDLNQSLLSLQRAVNLSSDNDLDKAIHLNNFGNSLRSRFEYLGDLGDINKSVLILQEALALRPDEHPDKPSLLCNLGASLLCRFKQLKDLTDMNKSVMIFQQAIALTPDGDPEKPLRLANLGASLLRRFQQFKSPDDINDSVLMIQQAVELTPDSDQNKAAWLYNLGNCLSCRFEQFGDLGDINQSVLVLQQAVQLTPDGHPNKPRWFEGLGNSLSRRFKQCGNLIDLNESVLMFQQAVGLSPYGHSDRAGRLDNLGRSLEDRFQQLRDLNDINKSVLIFQQAVQLTPDEDPKKLIRFTHLGNSLRHRFEQLGDLNDINESVMQYEKAAKLAPDSHPDKPRVFKGLGNSLMRRFQQLGDLGDINKSVLMFQRAAELIPDGDPDRAALLHNFGNSLMCRYERLGDHDDINEAALMYQQAVILIPDSDLSKPTVLSGLGNSLSHRFEQMGYPDDIKKSIWASQQALKLTADGHPDKPTFLNNLGRSLSNRFKHLRDPIDIDKSVMIYQQAVNLIPVGHPNKPASFSNLGISLSYRFEQSKDISDLNESILMLQQAIELTPDGHPDKVGYLNNLGSSLWARFQQLRNPDDHNQMLSHYMSAACLSTGPASTRFYAASMWAKHAQSIQHSSLHHAYSVALGLLPDIAWLGLSIHDRHYHVLAAGRVVRAAVAAAITTAQYHKAVEWFEQGRSVIWDQLLNLRTPVDALREIYPDLADKFVSLSMQLEGAGTRAASPQIIHMDLSSETFQSTAQQYHESAHERDRLLKEIRRLNGFERFLLPKTMSELSLAAEKGPIILLNTSEFRCDALVLTPGLAEEVLHIPLPNFTFEHGQNLAKSMTALVHTGQRGERLGMQREGHVPREVQLATILSDLWSQVVKPVLDGLSITNPSRENLQRIWWCPTGPLSFLPVHAAGLYGDNEAFGSKLSDFVIPSYVPSLSALIKGLQAKPLLEDRLQLLAIAQPSAVGQAYIPGTREELNHIERLATGNVAVMRLEENAATVGSIQQGMKDSRWVHFACHGVQDISAPTQSALLLAGSSQLTLSSIIKLSLPHADFAFLSACQTATGNEGLSEESVHLAAGMLLAGYHGVIATMWSIMDDDAPQVAADVYEHLFRTSPPDPTQAAEALHLAVRKLCKASDGKKSLFHWVPFIHVGF
ncbi:hypothetical protein MVEN_01585900 [Mycena venus]|uniref:CHAT domain-containing protein n=1 Tax=Mycena venus TaxID=2733690 RepID=A0A8H6XPN8_9AGAR|nr:hypothetical protein MVEN_01585900 [Mycena venus]